MTWIKTLARWKAHWLLAAGAVAVIGYLGRDLWRPVAERWLAAARPVEAAGEAHGHETESLAEPNELVLSRKARKNLGLVVKAVQPQTYWRTVLIPGEIVDRPGISDRGVTSPAVGVVTRVHRFPGDVVRPGETLVSLRLVSEYLHTSQAELFKATQEQELVSEQIARLEGLAKGGAIPEARIIELNNQLRRQKVLITAHRQDLLTRGLSPSQLDQIAQGKFITTIDVPAPPALPFLPAAGGPAAEEPPSSQDPASSGEEAFVYELQELAVELGQQVQAGQLLAKLSNHQFLYVVGHAFKREAPLLEAAAQERRPIEVEFAEDDARYWPPLNQELQIRHLANALDPQSRTFDFFVPLTNQSRRYDQQGAWFLTWRFRPGQRARLHVPVEQFANVFVLPAASVARDGPEAYVFVYAGGHFIRRAVHVLHEDRRHAVIANDGAIRPGARLAQSGAASLLRVLKAQASGEAASGHEHHHDH